MAKVSNIINVDFSDVKESSGINPRHQEEGDYLMKITQTEMRKTKSDDPMLFVLLQDANMRSATYPYYCTMQPNMLWKIRNIFIAAGLPVPKGKGKLDITKLVGKEIGVTLIDDEYDGKMKSVIDAAFHKDELEPLEAEDDDEIEDDEEVEDLDDVEDDEEEEEAPPVKKSKAKAKKAPEPEPEEDDEEEEEEEVEPEPVKKKTKAKAKAKPAPVEDDEDEDDDELDLDDI